MLIFTLICVALVIVVEFTVTSEPKLTLLTPSRKFVPVNTTFMLLPLPARVGETLDRVGEGLFTVKAPESVAVPPPGAALVTVISRGPGVAPMSMVTLAVTWVEVKEETELTVMPLPYAGVVTPGMKFVPVTVTLRVCPRFPLVGVMLASVGAGLLTVKPPLRTVVPPPGAALTTDTSRTPKAASSGMVIFTVICVALLTVEEFTVIPEPKLTVLTPATKFVPMRVTFFVSPLTPVAGLALASVGAGLPIVKALFSVTDPPPGPALLTVTSRAPVAACGAMVILAVSVVVPDVATEFTVTSAPKLTVVAPE
jgi:hypothetical protein